jgi:hypothetical protein
MEPTGPNASHRASVSISPFGAPPLLAISTEKSLKQMWLARWWRLDRDNHSHPDFLRDFSFAISSHNPHDT